MGASCWSLVSRHRRDPLVGRRCFADYADADADDNADIDAVKYDMMMMMLVLTLIKMVAVFDHL